MTLPVGHRAAATDAYQRILDQIAPNASRLKASYNGHLARALLVAVNLHLLGLALFWVVSYATATPAVPTTSTPPYEVEDYLLPEPPLNPPATPPGGTPSPPRAGVVTLQPDDVADPDATTSMESEISDYTPGPASDTPSGGPGTGPTGSDPSPMPYVPHVETDPPSNPPQRPEPEPTPAPVTDDVLPFSEINPVLIGGIEGLQAGIAYPAFERDARIEGRVVVQFVVGEDGVPSQITVGRSVSAGLDAAAVAAVRAARFVPGRQNGRAVKVRFTLPVTFRIR